MGCVRGAGAQCHEKRRLKKFMIQKLNRWDMLFKEEHLCAALVNCNLEFRPGVSEEGRHTDTKPDVLQRAHVLCLLPSQETIICLEFIFVSSIT